ncbi:MAG: serine hydrolase domain-containing protein [Christensenellales bacterium]|jgi:CubicO group peptidase (beta-lactamase class C family)
MTPERILEDALRQGINEGIFTAGCAAVGVKDDVFGSICVGHAPLPEDAPTNEHTKFDMASLSKILGPTMIALRALEDGTLSLDETIGDFLPEAPQDKRDITVQMLMTHTAGFEAHFRMDQMLDSPEEALPLLLRHPLAEKPGTVPIYSCMGYITFGKMLERRFGKPLRVLAKERVFEPLGMAETSYCPDAGSICAATEIDPSTGKPIIGVVHDENARFLGGNSGNAGVFMPLTDGMRFAKMLSGMGNGYLRRETMKKAIHNYTKGQEEHRGLGFQIAGTELCFFSDRVPDTCFGHTGFTGTSMMVEPETGFWVVLLTNRVYPTRESAKMFPWRRKLHGDLWEAYR